MTWVKARRRARAYRWTMYQRILLATDGSALSRKAEHAAIELASALGARLVVLHVVPRYPVSYYEGAVSFTSAEVGRIEGASAARAQASADAVVEAADASEVAAKAVVVRSDLVAEAILAAVRKHRCDLIVMASHGRKGLKRLLLGSETLHVLTHGKTPVLVLR